MRTIVRLPCPLRGALLLSWLWLLPAVLAAAGTPPPAAADTLFLRYKNDAPFGHYFAYCLDPYGRAGTGARAAALWAAGRFRPLPAGREVLQAGFTQDRLWLRATVVNTLPQRARFVWSVYQFVDSAALFVQPSGQGRPRYETGASSWVVAGRRVFRLRANCLPFWLEGHARAVLYLRVENHSGALYVPTDLSTTEDILASEEDFIASQHWIWLLGLYSGSALFNLILFVFLRDRIHLWYGAYIFFLTWFLLMEDGLDAVLLPQGVYGLGWQVGQYGLLLLALACGLRVMGLVREGLSTRAIAFRLSLAEFTVSTHRRNLMQKLGVHGLAELVRFANEHGL